MSTASDCLAARLMLGEGLDELLGEVATVAWDLVSATSAAGALTIKVNIPSR